MDTVIPVIPFVGDTGMLTNFPKAAALEEGKTTFAKSGFYVLL
jgi:hypothetical protein